MDRDSMICAMARLAYAKAWADLQERTAMAQDAGIDIGDYEPSNLSGCNIFDVMPEEIPEVAFDKARDIAEEIETGNGRLPLDVLWRDVCTRVLASSPCKLESLADRFAECLYYEATGAGVSWEDDYDAHGLWIPSFEGLFYGEIPEGDALPEAFWDWCRNH